MDPTSLIIQGIVGAAGGNMAGLLNLARSYGPGGILIPLIAGIFKKPAA